ncbi:hypothetical protein ACROYT_G025851 [Oculina patagonica]
MSISSLYTPSGVHKGFRSHRVRILHMALGIRIPNHVYSMKVTGVKQRLGNCGLITATDWKITEKLQLLYWKGPSSSKIVNKTLLELKDTL